MYLNTIVICQSVEERGRKSSRPRGYELVREYMSNSIFI